MKDETDCAYASLKSARAGWHEAYKLNREVGVSWSILASHYQHVCTDWPAGSGLVREQKLRLPSSCIFFFVYSVQVLSPNQNYFVLLPRLDNLTYLF